MSDSFEYIERYFTNALSAAERKDFEDKCLSDPSLAQDLALYIAMRDKIKEQLHDEKRKEFSKLHQQLSARKTPSPNIIVRLQPFIVAAAACLILYWGWSAFFSKPSPEKIAGSYIATHFGNIGIPMGRDTANKLEDGIAAYNRKNFSEAEKIFQSLQNGPKKPEATEYLGILYLNTGQYDKALKEFDALSQNQQLFVNPGLFYKAVTLMKRSATGDKEQARAILMEVIHKELPGAKEAKEWIGAL